MGKPRLIILIRHAESEGNKNKTIHQHTPDHRVGLTSEGHKQSRAAGAKLRALLRSDDTLHFFVSPYRRTRETTEGILESLCSDNPSPSPFKRSQIKVYEEPRLREQDFGNFQPGTEEVERLWTERASYGHFFYRIPNGESGADCYDRVSSFNDSLWRRFGEPNMASVAILVTHGLMARVFLMKWYHWSVEFFEDLRNINHVEFLVMKLNQESGKYVLQNQLRTWSDLKRERAARGSFSLSSSAELVIPTRRTWGGCAEDCTDPDCDRSHPEPRRPVRRKNTADLFKDDIEVFSPTPTKSLSSSMLNREQYSIPEDTNASNEGVPPFGQYASSRTRTDTIVPAPVDNMVSQPMQGQHIRSRSIMYRGRDGGGTRSGAASPFSSSEEGEADPAVPTPTSDTIKSPNLPLNAIKPRSLAKALRGELDMRGRAMADALGDQSDKEVEEADAELGDKEREREEMERILDDERRDRGGRRGGY